MSRIGYKPITIPEGTQVEIADSVVTVKGPKGELQYTVPRKIKVEQKDNELVITRSNDSRPVKALHGTTRSVLFNLISGVNQGFEKELELVGTGYRARLQGKKIVLSVGLSHEVEFNIPEGVTVEVEGTNKVKLASADKHLVGQVAADIRAIKPPEPYKGKGIRYSGEIVRRKAGKAVKTGAA